MDRVTEFFFWIGTLVVLLRINRRPYQLALLGLLIGALPAIFVPGAEGRRYLLGIVLILLFASIGIDFAIRLISLLFYKLRPVTASLWASGAIRQGAVAFSLAGFITFFAFTNVAHNFREWASGPSAKWSLTNELVSALRYVKTLDQDTYVYFYSRRWDFEYPVRRFMLPNTQGETRSGEGPDEADLRLDQQKKVVYLLLGEYHTLIPQLQETYPGGDYHEERDDNGQVLFAAYTVAR